MRNRPTAGGNDSDEDADEDRKGLTSLSPADRSPVPSSTVSNQPLLPKNSAELDVQAGFSLLQPAAGEQQKEAGLS